MNSWKNWTHGHALKRAGACADAFLIRRLAALAVRGGGVRVLGHVVGAAMERRCPCPPSRSFAHEGICLFACLLGGISSKFSSRCSRNHGARVLGGISIRFSGICVVRARCVHDSKGSLRGHGGFPAEGPLVLAWLLCGPTAIPTRFQRETDAVSTRFSSGSVADAT